MMATSPPSVHPPLEGGKDRFSAPWISWLSGLVDQAYGIVNRIQFSTTTQVIIPVSGNPNGVVSATPGSLGLSDNGKLYVKEGGGSGNTGWVQK